VPITTVQISTSQVVKEIVSPLESMYKRELQWIPGFATLLRNVWLLLMNMSGEAKMSF
jgi:hypothetical protein